MGACNPPPQAFITLSQFSTIVGAYQAVFISIEELEVPYEIIISSMYINQMVRSN